MSTTWRWTLTAAIVVAVVGVVSWLGYHWPEVTRWLESAGMKGWRLLLVRSLLVPGSGILGGLLIRWIWRTREHGAQDN